MTEEEIISALLPCQQLVIAKASLAGFRFERHADTRRINQGYRHGSWDKGELIDDNWYWLFDPNGERIGTYEDIYEAACHAVDRLEENMKPKDVVGFELEEGNEQ